MCITRAIEDLGQGDWFIVRDGDSECDTSPDSVREKAALAAVKILANSTHYPCLKQKGYPECDMCENADRRRREVADIITAEFESPK